VFPTLIYEDQMQYSYVYIDGKYSVRSERGDYACHQTASGPKLRKWPTAAAAERWITGPFIAHCPELVWGLPDPVVQAKPGQPSMHHRTHVPANGYKPAHGGYPDATGPRKVVPLSEDMEAFYQELKAMAAGYPEPFVLYTAHKGSSTGRMRSSSPAFQEVKRTRDVLIQSGPFRPTKMVHKFVDGNEEASTIPDDVAGKLPTEPMTLGEVLRFLQS